MLRIITPPNHTTTTAEPPSATLRRKVVGTNEEGVARSVATSGTPSLYSFAHGILYRQDLSLRKMAHYEWDVEIPYGPRPNETGEWTWDFDTTGGTVHITTAKQTVGSYPIGQAPDFQNLIGVEGESVQGVDITIPVMRFNVQYKHPLGTVTIPFAKKIHNLTGKVSSAAMLGFAAGEVLFLGGRGSDGTTADATVTYSFAMSANATDLSFGAINNVVKKGWEVAWVSYKDDVDGGLPVKVPEFAFVNRVYDTVDLAAELGFGA